jgi:hypothetical protein
LSIIVGEGASNSSPDIAGKKRTFNSLFRLPNNINRRDMEKWENMFAVFADTCMTLQKEIRRATSLPAFHSINCPMNGYVPSVVLARKSFLLNSSKLILEGTFEDPCRVDCRLLGANWLHVFSMGVNNCLERFLGDEHSRCVI